MYQQLSGKRGIVTDIWSSVTHCSFELVFVGRRSGSRRQHSGVRTDVRAADQELLHYPHTIFRVFCKETNPKAAN